MLWGEMSSCAQHHSNNGLERLVLRSAPHVFRRGRYITAVIVAKIDSCSAVLRTCSVEVVTSSLSALCIQINAEYYLMAGPAAHTATHTMYQYCVSPKS